MRPKGPFCSLQMLPFKGEHAGKLNAHYALRGWQNAIVGAKEYLLSLIDPVVGYAIRLLSSRSRLTKMYICKHCIYETWHDTPVDQLPNS